jgi:hypothetical protein
MKIIVTAKLWLSVSVYVSATMRFHRKNGDDGYQMNLLEITNTQFIHTQLNLIFLR